MEESRKILCLRKISSNTHADQGQASVFGSVWKSPGSFCVYERSVLTHMQIKVRLQCLAVCGRVQEDFVVEESRKILCLRKTSSNTHADQL